jgi:hypothetical protein
MLICRVDSKPIWALTGCGSIEHVNPQPDFKTALTPFFHGLPIARHGIFNGDKAP